MEPSAEKRLPHLRALLQHYEMTGCWCGCGFEDVVNSYLASPDMPDVMADIYRKAAADPNAHPALIAHYRHDIDRMLNFDCLTRSREMLPVERRDGLCAELERLLATSRSAEELKREIGPFDERELIAFSEFWSADGDSVLREDFVAEFVRQTISYARSYTPNSLDAAANARETAARETERRHQFAEIFASATPIANVSAPPPSSQSM